MSLFNHARPKILAFMARLILGGVFIIASLDKIAFPQAFAKIVINYNILPPAIATLFSYILPYIELIFGVLLIIGFFKRTSALILSALLFTFIVAILITSMNGNISNCGCIFFSSTSKEPNPIFLIIRNVILIMIGALIVLKNRTDNNFKAEELSNDKKSRQFK